MQNPSDWTIELHKRQYEAADRVRFGGEENARAGLWKTERFFLGKYFKPYRPTLEIGCGTGRIAFGMEKELRFSSIVATDFVKIFIENASIVAKQSKSGVRFAVCGATDLPFHEKSFDGIVCLGLVLSHLPHRAQRLQALREFYRVLDDGGLLIVNALNDEFDNAGGNIYLLGKKAKS